MIKYKILEKYESLPDSLKTEVDRYIDFLLGKYVKTGIPPRQEAIKEAIKKESEKSHSYGSLAGKIIMSDDFDEPLEDLKEYM